MKICIPVLENKGMASAMSPHFGQAGLFAVIDDTNDELTFVENNGTHHGGTLMPPEILHNAGVNVMLCGGLGVKAVRMFQKFKIKVYSNASGSVQDVFAAFKAGQLMEASENSACQEHGH